MDSSPSTRDCSETQEDSRRDNELPAAKRAKIDESGGEVDLEKVKRQVEYYLSDENLKYDKFFNEKLREHPEGWLPFANILSCKRIQALKATEKDIIAALKDSTVVEVDAAGGAVRRLTAIPELQERPPRREVRENSRESASRKGLGRVTDVHAAGLIIKISGLPEEASWETLRKCLQEKLPPDEERQKETGGSFIERTIRFVSHPTNDGACYCLLRPFPDDRAFIAKLGGGGAPGEGASGHGQGAALPDSDSGASDDSRLRINGVCLKVAVAETKEAVEFVESLPHTLKKRWQLDCQRKKQAMNNRPVKVGGQEFESIDYLKRCLKEAMQTFPIGKPVNQKTSGVLKHLLEEFHPGGKKKLENFKEFKVDLMTVKGKNGKEDSHRCFFVVREDGSTEDFSLLKCFGPLTQKPPFVRPPQQAAQQTTAQYAEAQGAEAQGAEAQSAEPAQTSPPQQSEETKPAAPTEAS